MPVGARGVGFPEIGITDGCEWPCECWKLNPGPLEEQTTSASAPSS